jgi:hypothetical protein
MMAKTLNPASVGMALSPSPEAERESGGSRLRDAPFYLAAVRSAIGGMSRENPGSLRVVNRAPQATKTR